jgi:hypothetical protein
MFTEKKKRNRTGPNLGALGALVVNPSGPLTGLVDYGGACRGRGCVVTLPPFAAPASDRRRIEEYRASLAAQGWDLGRGLCPECATKTGGEHANRL